MDYEVDYTWLIRGWRIFNSKQIKNKHENISERTWYAQS